MDLQTNEGLNINISPSSPNLLQIKKSHIAAALFIIGSPSGVRTRVTGVRGRRPKPLDDGTIYLNLLGA